MCASSRVATIIERHKTPRERSQKAGFFGEDIESDAESFIRRAYIIFCIFATMIESRSVLL